jgi:CBS domain-containing protein
MTISSIIREKGNSVVSVSASTPVQTIAEIISSKRIGAVVVLDGSGKLIGIVSERDVVKALAAEPAAVHTMLAEQIMTRAVTTATLATSIEDAMEIMDHGYFRHLPVVDGDVLVGIVSIRDLVKTRIRLQEHETNSLRSYVEGRFA